MRKTKRAVVRHDATALAVLAAALELYHNRLLNDARALDFLARGGFSGEVVERWRLGFAAGGQVVGYIVWRGLPVSRDRHHGLLIRYGCERLSGVTMMPGQHT